MKNIRIVARLDIKAPNVVKGIQLEGFRVIGNPNELVQKYYLDGADEIVYMDIVASLYERNGIENIVREATKNVFIPITVGGGIRTIDDVHMLLNAGADKVAVNTAAIKNPNIITKISRKYGSQCMVSSLEVKKIKEGKWEIYYDNGRESTGIDAIEWAKKVFNLGAGEILLTSVDRDGAKKGMDIEIIRRISLTVPIPVIASGGIGKKEDIEEAVYSGKADAVAIGTALHYNLTSIGEIKNYANSVNINVRI